MRKVRKGDKPTETQVDQPHETDYADFYAHDYFVGRDQYSIQEHKPWENQMMWNYFLVRDFYELVKRKKWVMPVVHGSIDFANFVDSGN